MTLPQLSNQELIEKCEVEISGFQQRGVRCGEYTELLSRFRTLSGQGKLHTDVERIIDKVHEVSDPNPMHPPHHITDPIIEVRESALREVLINNQLTQPAPVSVEDVMKAVEESVHPSDHINYSKLRKSLQTLFNPK